MCRVRLSAIRCGFAASGCLPSGVALLRPAVCHPVWLYHVRLSAIRCGVAASGWLPSGVVLPRPAVCHPVWLSRVRPSAIRCGFAPSGRLPSGVVLPRAGGFHNHIDHLAGPCLLSSSRAEHGVPCVQLRAGRGRLRVQCCFTSTETTGTISDGHLVFHTAPEVLC